MPLDINAIRTLISNGDTDQALAGLQLHFQENPGGALFNDLILIQSRWSSYRRNATMGLGADPNTPNQVNFALLNLLDQMEKPQVVATPNTPTPLPIPAGIPKFVVIYDIADDAHCKMLNKHLNVLKITKKIRVYNVNDGAAGGDFMAAARTELADSAYILALITANLFGSDWFGLLEEERVAGRRIIPIRLEKVGGYEELDLVKLRSLPTMNRTVSDFANQDTAYADIVGEIRKLL